MSGELVVPLRETLEGEALVLHLAATLTTLEASDVPVLDGVVLELSDEVFGEDADRAVVLAGIPVAGLPVAHDSEAFATKAGVATILRGPEDLETWMASLTEATHVSERNAPGQIIAIWGPAGAPGRSTVALALSATLARRGAKVMTIDGDTYAPSLAPLLGLLPSQSGVVALSRLARVEGASADALADCAMSFDSGGLRLPVITGIHSPAQYADCGSLAWSQALSTLRNAGHTVVIDLAPPLLELPHEVIGGPRRNALAIATLEVADRVVVVARAQPVSIMRLSREWPRLGELAPTADIDVALNAVPPHSQAASDESAQALWQFTGHDELWTLPYDRAWADSSADYGDLLVQSSRKNAFLGALASLVTDKIAPVGKPLPPSVKRSVKAGGWVALSELWRAPAKKRLP
jgi:MinD-like ATPase involved in chromosome partitioning or flagellar assembly